RPRSPAGNNARPTHGRPGGSGKCSRAGAVSALGRTAMSCTGVQQCPARAYSNALHGRTAISCTGVQQCPANKQTKRAVLPPVLL
ncbi:MAG: hypothetical protein FWG06_02610, partial [Clostridiales bacterium]|nr:hypothetical protein [Clostridiales bacterium]